MLRITIPAAEYWDEEKEQFVYVKEQKLQLEHSLVSLSKWESKWEKPFLSEGDISYEEMVDYIRCMTITQNVDPEVYNRLTYENIKEIDDYINSAMTATTFSDDKKKSTSRKIITSEIIYYWMIAHDIPPEYQKWHLNRLLTLIKVCNIESQPKKKMSKRDTLKQNSTINAARRKRLNTRG